MSKEDIKAFFLIIVMISLLAILAVLGINIYLEVSGKDTNIITLLEEGYTAILGEIEEKIEVNTLPNNILNQVQSSETNSQDVQQNESTEDVSKEKYFYSQLNTYAKLIYDELEKNKENMKSGTYKIELGDKFSDLLKQENGEELLKSYYQSAIETYLYDNPEVFYLEPSKMYINIQTIKKIFTTQYNVFIDSGKEEDYFNEEFNLKEQILLYENEIEKESNKILASVEGETDYKKIMKIHDYLVKNVSFDQTLLEENIYNLYGALVDRKAVCEGYAKAFKYLLDKCGIECVMVIGTATNSENSTQSHAWNYVKLNNKWYAVDVTWDDPIIIGQGFWGNSFRYKYFLKGSNTINKDHFKNGQFTENGQVYTYPILSMTDY